MSSEWRQISERFAVLAASASQVTSATLTRIVDRVDDGVHAIEAFAPGPNETMLFNSVFQTVGGSLTLGSRAACSEVGFYRLLGEQEFPGWESRVSEAYNSSATVLTPHSTVPPAKAWAMALEATVPPTLDTYKIGDAISELAGVADVVSRIRLGRVSALEQQVFAGGRGPESMVFGAVFAHPNATAPGAVPPRGQVAVLASPAGDGLRLHPELTRRPPGVAPHALDKQLIGMLGCNLNTTMLTAHWVNALASSAKDLFAIVQDVSDFDMHHCEEVSATVDANFHGPASGPIAGELFRTCANGTQAASLGHSNDVVPAVTGDTEAIVQQADIEPIVCDRPEHVLVATANGHDGMAAPQAPASASAEEAAALATAALRLRCEAVRDRFAEVAGMGLRAQFRTHLAGRMWLVSIAASKAIQDSMSPAAMAPAVAAACLAAACAAVVCLLATASISASKQRLLAAELHRAEAAELARAVHYTTVSFLAHEARGALAVTSTTVEALAEGLSRFGIRLPSGRTLRPGQLIGSEVPETRGPASFGDQSEASMLIRPASGASFSRDRSRSLQDSLGDSLDDFEALSVAELLHDLEVVQAAAAVCLRVIGDAADVIGVDSRPAQLALTVTPLRRLTSDIVLRARRMASVPITTRWASATHRAAMLDPTLAEVVIANSMIFVLKQASSEELVVTMSNGSSPLTDAWFQEHPPELGIVAATTAQLPLHDEGCACGSASWPD